MPEVLNAYKNRGGTNAIYIGRPSRWGNPFAIGPNCTREEAVRKYEEWLMSQPELVAAVKLELKGLDLVCFCAPKQCHGDILLRVANEGEN